VRLSANGDIIQGFHALKELRKRFPNAHIGWAVGEAGASLLDAVEPWVDTVHVLPKSWSKELPKIVLKWGSVSQEITQVLDDIRREHYEIAFDIQGLNKSALLPLLTDIPHRVGFENAREQARFLYTDTPAALGSVTAPRHHAVDEFAELLKNYPCSDVLPALVYLPMKPLDASLLPILKPLREAREQGRPVLGFAPFTMWSSKHWPVHHWSDFIRQSLQKHPNAIGLCIGGPDDVISWERLNATIPNGLHRQLINAQGKTSFIGLMHLLNQVDVLIGSDSAPMHIMDWLVREGLNPNGKSIALMGATHPKRTGPLHDTSIALNADLPCIPCHKRECPLGSLACMEMLTVKQVMDNLTTMLNQKL